ncbi:hypothetical protein N7491_000748 [Penicillium cf. griseofulvum]|nr:hypothetical protein N7491_000748 [Penicillium cf. griseofulvum]
MTCSTSAVRSSLKALGARFPGCAVIWNDRCQERRENSTTLTQLFIGLDSAIHHLGSSMETLFWTETCSTPANMQHAACINNHHRLPNRAGA